LHYACYFGKIKALRALCEEFKADVTAIDFRGQTPLHVATSSGELGAVLYLTSRLNSDTAQVNEAKDNALMTPLMNSVAVGNVASFIHFLFDQHCSLNTVDISGNTIMHTAAKANAIHVAKILFHVYRDMKASPNSRFKEDRRGDQDNQYLFFDLDRTNLQG
jgi:ankyrin repeat protein